MVIAKRAFLMQGAQIKSALTQVDEHRLTFFFEFLKYVSSIGFNDIFHRKLLIPPHSRHIAIHL